MNIFRTTVFPVAKEYSEKNIKLIFRLARRRVECVVNLPWLLHFVWVRQGKKAPETGIEKFQPKHIRQFRAGRHFRTGTDSYNGECALLLPVFKLWLSCDFLSAQFRRRGNFSVFYFLLKISVFEITFRFALLGMQLALHLAFYDIPWLREIRNERVRRFWEGGK